MLAARAQLALGNATAAGPLFDRARARCPALAAEIGRRREEAGREWFRVGVLAFARKDLPAAVAAWETSARIDRRADALFNLGVAYGRGDDPEHAVAAFHDALDALAAAERAPRERTVPERETDARMRLDAVAGIFDLGARLLERHRFAEADAMFRELIAVDRTHRDAWYGRALALYQLGRWAELLDVAARVLELDPLNYNAQVHLFNAHTALGDAAARAGDEAGRAAHHDRALRLYAGVDSLPADLAGLFLQARGGKTTLRGTLTGRAAPEGTPIRLEFTFYAFGAPLATRTVTVAAPAKGARTTVEVTVDGVAATSFGYRVATDRGRAGGG